MREERIRFKGGRKIKTLVTVVPPVITPAMARINKSCSYYDSSKAAEEVGMTQIPRRTNVEKAVNWFRENSYVGRH